MKKFIALFAICAMVTCVLATDFGALNWQAGGFTLPVVYTGTLKAAGWEDKGLCYNWEKDKDSTPLFFGVCQPCLECVPCDIDMQHADPIADSDSPQSAYFNRARLYIVTAVDKKEKKATIQVVDLIDAYGDNKPYETFQFYNTVDSIKYETKPEKGRIAAFFSFPVISRNSGYGLVLNQFDGYLGSIDDGIGMAALIGTKDSKSWFKQGKSTYKIISIKKMDGDLLIAQDSFIDTPCLKGSDNKYNDQSAEETALNGAGAWWNTASISLRRNNSATKKMISEVTSDAVVQGCIPCKKVTDVSACREYLDHGMVKYLIEKKYKKYTITYKVDTSPVDYIYGTTDESFVGNDEYLGSLDFSTTAP